MPSAPAPPPGEEEKEESRFKWGPFEQVLAVVLVLGFASNPSIPYSFLQPLSGWITDQGAPGPSVGTGYSARPHAAFRGDGTPIGVGSAAYTPSNPGFPFLSPPLIFLAFIAYAGYHILRRQEYTRARHLALAKAAEANAKSSSSSSSSGTSSSKDGGGSKPMSSSDVRSGGYPSKSSSSSAGKGGDPGPRKVRDSNGKEVKEKDQDKYTLPGFKKNFFLTMQGPGRPALVPFQEGLRPKAGEGEGGMWWDNVPEDASGLMAPPVDESKLRAMMKNPWAMEMVTKDLELLKLKKRKLEEEEAYGKVANILQTILGLLLCLVDMRLGIALTLFFLWRHCTSLQNDDSKKIKEQLEKDIAKTEREVSKARYA